MDIIVYNMSYKLGIVRELNRDDIRQVIVGDYRIIYRVKRKTPEVISVRHCRFPISSTHTL